MFKTRVLVLAVLALAAPAYAQPKLPSAIQVEVGKKAQVLAVTDADEVKVGELDSGFFTTIREFTDPKTFSYYVFGAKTGTGYVVLSSVKGGKLQDLIVVRVTVVPNKDPGPAPEPPPPGPGPPPTPPPTPPAPGPVAPIAGPGFKVMILYDARQTSKLTVGQDAAIYGATTRTYLKEKAPGNYFIVDPNTNMTAAPKEFQDALNRPRTELPWVMISNGTSGYEGPLPKTLTEIQALLTKWGGQ